MFSQRILSPAQVAAADQSAAQVADLIGAHGVTPVSVAGRHDGKLQIGTSSVVILANRDATYDLVCIHGGRIRPVANQIAGDHLAVRLAWHLESARTAAGTRRTS